MFGLSLRKTYPWWSPKSSYFWILCEICRISWNPADHEIHLKTIKSNNSRKTSVSWSAVGRLRLMTSHEIRRISSDFMKSATKDQLPGMVRPMFLPCIIFLNPKKWNTSLTDAHQAKSPILKNWTVDTVAQNCNAWSETYFTLEPTKVVLILNRGRLNMWLTVSAQS